MADIVTGQYVKIDQTPASSNDTFLWRLVRDYQFYALEETKKAPEIGDWRYLESTF